MRTALILILGLALAAIESEAVQAVVNADLIPALLVQAAADLVIVNYQYKLPFTASIHCNVHKCRYV